MQGVELSFSSNRITYVPLIFSRGSNVVLLPLAEDRPVDVFSRTWPLIIYIDFWVYSPSYRFRSMNRNIQNMCVAYYSLYRCLGELLPLHESQYDLMPFFFMYIVFWGNCFRSMDRNMTIVPHYSFLCHFIRWKRCGAITAR